MISFKDLIATAGTSSLPTRNDLTFDPEDGGFVLGTLILKSLGTNALSLHVHNGTEVVLIGDAEGKICKARTRQDGTKMDRSGKFRSAKMKELVQKYYPDTTVFDLIPETIQEDLSLQVWILRPFSPNTNVIVDDVEDEEESGEPDYAEFNLTEETNE